MDTMIAERERLKGLIEHWEDLEKRAKEMLPHLRHAYAALNGVSAAEIAPGTGKSAKPSKSPKLSRAKGKQTFEPRYQKSSKELAYDLLAKNGEKMTASEVVGMLKSDGFEFSDPAVAAGLNDLVKARRAKRLKAPHGSRARWAYKAIVPKPAEKTRPANAFAGLEGDEGGDTPTS